MPTSAIDSAVFRHIFGTEQMRKVWSDENRTQRYLDIEGAPAQARANLGAIPGLCRVGSPARRGSDGCYDGGP